MQTSPGQLLKPLRGASSAQVVRVAPDRIFVTQWLAESFTQADFDALCGQPVTVYVMPAVKTVFNAERNTACD